MKGRRHKEATETAPWAGLTHAGGPCDDTLCYKHTYRSQWADDAGNTGGTPAFGNVHAMTAYQSQENPYVDPGGHSLGQLWAVDYTDANGTDLGEGQKLTIETGWRKTRSDPGPRLFVFWSSNNYSSWCYIGGLGCHNAPSGTCWQAYGGAVETVNDYIGYADIYHKYSINKGDNNTWWIWHDNQWLGYITSNCFSRPFNFINRMEYGGETAATNTSPVGARRPCTDMGNSQPGTSGIAARFSQAWRSMPGASYYFNDAHVHQVYDANDPQQQVVYPYGFVEASGVGDFRYGGGGYCGISNRAPSASLSVNPAGGQPAVNGVDGTSFNASLSGTDPDGEPSLAHRIEWGDGVVTYNTGSGSHVYQNPGTYTIRGIVTDPYGAVGTSIRTVRVCRVYVANTGTCLN